MSNTRRRRAEYEARGYREVAPTGAEVEAFRKANHGRTPSAYRVECKRDGVRFWMTGLGVASHERSKAHHEAEGGEA